MSIRFLEPTAFPSLLWANKELLSYMYRSALHNAGRQGCSTEDIVSYQDETFCLQVVIRQEGSTKCPQQAAARPIVSGGSWLTTMQKCAQAMSGTFTVCKEPGQTIFELRCPLNSADEQQSKKPTPNVASSSSWKLPQEERPFALPAGTWDIVMDDSTTSNENCSSALSNLPGLRRNEASSWAKMLPRFIPFAILFNSSCRNMLKTSF